MPTLSELMASVLYAMNNYQVYILGGMVIAFGIWAVRHVYRAGLVDDDYGGPIEGASWEEDEGPYGMDMDVEHYGEG
jgi:hypothetical protein